MLFWKKGFIGYCRVIAVQTKYFFLQSQIIYKKKETKTEKMAKTHFSKGKTHLKYFKNYCSLPLQLMDFDKNQSSSTVNILLAITTFFGNSLTTVALRKESLIPCIRRPNSCIVVWQQLICYGGLRTLESLSIRKQGGLYQLRGSSRKSTVMIMS